MTKDFSSLSTTYPFERVVMNVRYPLGEVPRIIVRPRDHSTKFVVVCSPRLNSANIIDVKGEKGHAQRFCIVLGMRILLLASSGESLKKKIENDSVSAPHFCPSGTTRAQHRISPPSRLFHKNSIPDC
jgi:hypothetical protein